MNGHFCTHSRFVDSVSTIQNVCNTIVALAIQRQRGHKHASVSATIIAIAIAIDIGKWVWRTQETIGVATMVGQLRQQLDHAFIDHIQVDDQWLTLAIFVFCIMVHIFFIYLSNNKKKEGFDYMIYDIRHMTMNNNTGIEFGMEWLQWWERL
ncbi:hypothetical protein RFI_30688 [Reticulomyxa filosa]|uniref:Uncharacterized protein n=1 Tax=Reticulomyxa filosa TaxID=46433 RepID=X6LXM7_RETFI|nr:hypothetical protein RFI_30688 [Reticulomyxa filosa]|eukprot:ETO06703.1 hypothetical protein RFI_30688 [Reticulomyxa filosa]